MGPLKGVRVVDLTIDVARSAGQLLAGLGADVVRLHRGDPGPELGRHGPLLDWWFDAGTARIDVNLETENGRDEFRQLVVNADVLIEAEPPRSLTGRGLGRADLRTLNPALVHVSVTPFGSDGPRADWHSSDLVAQAMGGT
jgi:benzylsuccinate CoA-transferase BbsE subunit